MQVDSASTSHGEWMGEVLAGKVKRTSSWMQRLGFEWAFRIILEPGRRWNRYSVTFTVFCWWVVREAVAGVRRSSGVIFVQ